MSDRRVNFQVTGKAGKVLIVHHNHLKLSTIPQDGILPMCPIPRTRQIEITEGPIWGEGDSGGANPPMICKSTKLKAKHQAPCAMAI